jgi:hypothetical protein
MRDTTSDQDGVDVIRPIKAIDNPRGKIGNASHLQFLQKTFDQMR